MIDILCYGGSAGAFTFAFLMIVRAVFEDGWLAVPNGFNWIIECTVGGRRRKAERDAAKLAQRIAWLENCSRQWEELRAQGRDPLWTEVFGWIADAEPCSCGYVQECGIWCGDGHLTGQCAHVPNATVNEVAYGRMVKEARLVEKDAAGNVVVCEPDVGQPLTAEQYGRRIRPLMWDVEGAGGKYER
jgi:hypothetical protein